MVWVRHTTYNLSHCYIEEVYNEAVFMVMHEVRLKTIHFDFPHLITIKHKLKVYVACIFDVYRYLLSQSVTYQYKLVRSFLLPCRFTRRPTDRKRC